VHKFRTIPVTKHTAIKNTALLCICGKNNRFISCEFVMLACVIGMHKQEI